MRKTLPDFVVIGTMKSGTTTLHYILDQQPEISMSLLKETNFFSHQWERGFEWYAQMFAPATSDQLAGESSPSYMDPLYEQTAAERMAEVIPRARLMALLRDPVSRLRSQYRHQVYRGSEVRPFAVAVHPRSNYARLSLYFDRLKPYLDRFPRENILIVRFEDVFSDASPGWTQILGHLGLPGRPRPPGAWQVGADKKIWSKTRKRLELARIAQRARRLPGPIRAVGSKALAWTERIARARAAEADEAPIPGEVMDAIVADQEELLRVVGPVAHLDRLRAR